MIINIFICIIFEFVDEIFNPHHTYTHTNTWICICIIVYTYMVCHCSVVWGPEVWSVSGCKTVYQRKMWYSEREVDDGSLAVSDFSKERSLKVLLCKVIKCRKCMRERESLTSLTWTHRVSGYHNKNSFINNAIKNISTEKTPGLSAITIEMLEIS